VLQCVAVGYRVPVSCSELQCVAVCCSALQCVAVCCSVLQCVAVCCSVLQCVLQCVAVGYRVPEGLLYSTAQHRANFLTPYTPLSRSSTARTARVAAVHEERANSECTNSEWEVEGGGIKGVSLFAASPLGAAAGYKNAVASAQVHIGIRAHVPPDAVAGKEAEEEEDAACGGCLLMDASLDSSFVGV